MFGLILAKPHVVPSSYSAISTKYFGEFDHGSHTSYISTSNKNNSPNQTTEAETYKISLRNARHTLVIPSSYSRRTLAIPSSYPHHTLVVLSSYPRRTLVVPSSYSVISTQYFGEFDRGPHTSYISTSNKNTLPNRATEAKTSRNSLRNARHTILIPSSYPRRTIIVLSTYYRHISPHPRHASPCLPNTLGSSITSPIPLTYRHSTRTTHLTRRLNQKHRGFLVRNARHTSYPRRTLVVPSSYYRCTVDLLSSYLATTLSYPHRTSSYQPNTSESSIAGLIALTHRHPTSTTHLTRRLKHKHQGLCCEMLVIPSSYPRRTLVIPSSYCRRTVDLLSSYLAAPSSYPHRTSSYLPNTSESLITGLISFTHRHPTSTIHLTRRLKQKHKGVPCEMLATPSSYPRRTLSYLKNTSENSITGLIPLTYRHPTRTTHLTRRLKQTHHGFQ